MSRVERRAMAASAKYYRVTPLFHDGQQSRESHVVQGEIEDCVVVQVPLACSVEQAKKLEVQLTETMQKHVIIITKNIEFLKVELVETKEVSKLLKGGQNEIKEDSRVNLIASALKETIEEARRNIDTLPSDKPKT